MHRSPRNLRVMRLSFCNHQYCEFAVQRAQQFCLQPAGRTLLAPGVSEGVARTMTSQLTQPAIELRNVTKKFATPSGGVYTALRNLDLTVAPGEFCAVVGPTGCGKSTTLTLVSGLERPTQGEAMVAGKPVTGITPGVGFVF